MKARGPRPDQLGRGFECDASSLSTWPRLGPPARWQGPRAGGSSGLGREDRDEGVDSRKCRRCKRGPPQRCPYTKVASQRLVVRARGAVDPKVPQCKAARSENGPRAGAAGWTRPQSIRPCFVFVSAPKQVGRSRGFFATRSSSENCRGAQSCPSPSRQCRRWQRSARFLLRVSRRPWC